MIAVAGLGGTPRPALLQHMSELVRDQPPACIGLGPIPAATEIHVLTASERRSPIGTRVTISRRVGMDPDAGEVSAKTPLEELASGLLERSAGIRPPYVIQRLSQLLLQVRLVLDRQPFTAGRCRNATRPE